MNEFPGPRSRLCSGRLMILFLVFPGQAPLRHTGLTRESCVLALLPCLHTHRIGGAADARTCTHHRDRFWSMDLIDPMQKEEEDVRASPRSGRSTMIANTWLPRRESCAFFSPFPFHSFLARSRILWHEVSSGRHSTPLYQIQLDVLAKSAPSQSLCVASKQQSHAVQCSESKSLLVLTYYYCIVYGVEYSYIFSNTTSEEE
jgi:hypothetical protein